MDNPPNLNVLSLCAGYGGLELGLSRALENPLSVVGVEIEAYTLALLASKAEKNELAIEALYPDLRTFPRERFSGCFDIVIAGYPCQPFSVAGKRQGTDDPRHLWPHIARIVQAVKPVWCFFENVPGHLTLGFPEVYCSLRDMGYSVEAGLFGAAEVGANHLRERLYILAHANSQGQPQLSWRKQESGRRTCDCVEAGVSPNAMRQGYQSGQRLSNDTSQARSRSQRSTGPAHQSLGGSFEWRTWKIKPFLRREDDGHPQRLDEIGLLGNGVVPAQAERAIRELIEKHGFKSVKGVKDGNVGMCKVR